MMLKFKSWYYEHDAIVIGTWATMSVVLLCAGYSVFGFILAVVTFLFGMIGTVI